MPATLYMVTNKVNGKAYIGQTWRPVPRRWSQHKSCARGQRPTRFHRAIRQYGEDAFEIKTLVVGPAGDWMNELEIRAIAAYDTFNKGYNDTKGGDGGLGSKGRLGKTHSPEARAKISAARKGKATRLGHKNSAEHNEKVRRANLGKKLSAETVAKIVAANKGRVYKKGVIPSAETRLKMSLAHKGKKRSAEAIAKFSAARVGKKLSEETKEKISQARKARWAHLTDAQRAAEAAVFSKTCHVTGRKTSDAARQRQSVAMKAAWARRKGNK